VNGKFVSKASELIIYFVAGESTVGVGNNKFLWLYDMSQL